MMIRSLMEVLPPAATSACDSGGGGSWTPEENKRFEDALAKIDIGSPNCWERVAALIPGKTVLNVMTHYEELEKDVIEIEAGRVPCPVYGLCQSSFTLDWDSGYTFDGFKQSGKRSGGRAANPERKKGVPWTEEEHRLFLLGLKRYGKGDWRNISRNFVITRDPTQVASHAQKYFIRLNSGGKDKIRRSSIHDITTANLPDTISTPSIPGQYPSMMMMVLKAPSTTHGKEDQLIHAGNARNGVARS